MRRTLRPLAALSLMIAMAVGPASAAPAGCETDPTYDPSVTSPETFMSGWPDRIATTAELNDYMILVDTETDRVRLGTFGSSVNGTTLYYALVGHERNVAGARTVAARQQRLRDPRITTPAQAAGIADANPAIVWYMGNIHGGETSGGDAALSILYELAARTDCEVEGMLDELLVGIVATQNPDGRVANRRQNEYTFDLNRDWFALTQTESGGKIDLLAKYPPVLLVDAHQMGGGDFFFPPNADPIYHEVSPQSLHWINDYYGPALAAEFDERNQQDPTSWQHFSYDTYDLFYTGYGSTTPTNGFTAAGMTFEKGSSDTARQRWLEQFVAGWTTLGVAADHKDDILADYYEAHVQALAEGAAGELEPNEVFEPGNTVQTPVPDITIKHYFLDAGRNYPEVARLVDRLRRFGIEVYRLESPLAVSDLSAYGREPAAGVVPAGSFWIPMNQPQKRWVQGLLGEDTYVPFPYFYDVTAWSNPLMMNLQAWFSGSELAPQAVRIQRTPRGFIDGDPEGARHFRFPGDGQEAVAAALFLDRAGVEVQRLLETADVGRNRIVRRGAFIVPAGEGVAEHIEDAARRFRLEIRAGHEVPPQGVRIRQPKIGVFSGSGESMGHLRFFLDHRLEVPFTLLSAQQVAAGELTTGNYDVFIVGGAAATGLTPAVAQIRVWIETGGKYIGTTRPGASGGTPFAVTSGFTTAAITVAPEAQIPGTLFRVALDTSSPLTLGAPAFSYWYHLGEQVLEPSATGATPATFPEAEPDFWFSGYSEGHDPYRGSAGMVDEVLGDGRVLLFSGEPNFRAYTEGTMFLLGNAIAYPEEAGALGTDVASAAAAGAVARARASAGVPFGPGRPIRVEVPASQADRAEVVLRGLGAATVATTLAGDAAFLTVPNPSGLAPDQHPFSRRILSALERAGVEVRSAML